MDIPEYGWRTNSATNAHDFLLPKIYSELDRFSKSISQSCLCVFDAGCGNGFIAGRLIEMGHSVSGCDASEQGILLAQNSYPSGNFKVASVYDDLKTFFGMDYDVVISSEVIEHLYDPRLFLQKVASILRPGGLLIITTPYNGYLKNIALSVLGVMDRHYTVLWDGGHIKFWSYKTLKAVLQESGFSQFRFAGAGRAPFLWKSMIVSALK